jgi:hypothetical protein
MTHCQNANGSQRCPNPAEREYQDSHGKSWKLCLYCYLNTLAVLAGKKWADGELTAT